MVYTYTDGVDTYYTSLVYTDTSTSNGLQTYYFVSLGEPITSSFSPADRYVLRADDFNIVKAHRVYGKLVRNLSTNALAFYDMDQTPLQLVVHGDRTEILTATLELLQQHGFITAATPLLGW